jgi:hypothetical protein
LAADNERNLAIRKRIDRRERRQHVGGEAVVDE